ncbi:hypothetical protein CTI12_AA114310 [Artemisia annua]|uniref:18S pre-ribosomal assembly protein gar2-related protein n=1 Tax=Artemisia annua TaxID=35608 RepID=A0A2U1PTG0_ARTAN|nr:hypothetical protein CTI12_AA114310 [Artemisia annua]
MKESPERYVNPFLSDEENEKVNLWSNDEVSFSTNLEDEKFGKSLAPSDVPSEYIDKKVTECKFPELIYEESGFNVVKDICVDEGLSHGENIATVKGDEHDDMVEDDKLLSSPLEDFCKNAYLLSGCASDEFNLVIESKIVQSSENRGPDTSMQTSKSKSDVDQRLSEAPISGKMEENTASDSNNVKPTAINGPHELLLDTQSTPNHHDTSSDNITVSANQLQRGGGESSFSMAGPVSGLITFSGPVSSAGSISHRSDGSNTSVRSFAFPILQNEWNSSPVRMAKVDKRQSRKRQGWRQAFSCCGF